MMKMIRLTTIFVGCLALTLAKPPQDHGPKDGPGGHHRPGGPPPHFGGHPHDDGPKVQYAYDRIGKVAGFINMLAHECNKEFGKFREFWILESPTARAIQEQKSLVEFLIENELTDCLSDYSNFNITEYTKQNAEVVNTCLAGWKLDKTLQEEAKSLLKQLQELDDQAKTKLENCKPGETCYEEFLDSDLKKSIDEQLKEIREGKLVDARLRADGTTFVAVGDVAQCVTENTNELRLELYSTNAALSVCAAQYGLPPAH